MAAPERSWHSRMKNEKLQAPRGGSKFINLSEQSLMTHTCVWHWDYWWWMTYLASKYLRVWKIEPALKFSYSPHGHQPVECWTSRRRHTRIFCLTFGQFVSKCIHKISFLLLMNKIPIQQCVVVSLKFEWNSLLVECCLLLIANNYLLSTINNQQTWKT